jgi:hypothetical protein
MQVIGQVDAVNLRGISAGNVGHFMRNCWADKKDKGDKFKGKKEKEGKNRVEQSNTGEELVIFIVDEETYTFDTYNPYCFEGINECLILYDWLADTATTSI